MKTRGDQYIHISQEEGPQGSARFGLGQGRSAGVRGLRVGWSMGGCTAPERGTDGAWGYIAWSPGSVFHRKGGNGLGAATLRNVGVSAVRPGGIQGRGGLAYA